MKTFTYTFLMTLITLMLVSACSEYEEDLIQITKETEVLGVWKRNTEVIITEDVIIPPGKRLVIEQGVNIIFKGDALGTKDAPEISVYGALVIKGVKGNPVTFTVDEALQTKENRHRGLWGGIICAESCRDLAIRYAVIEYAGAPAGSNSVLLELGGQEGDLRSGVLFGNVQGRFAMHNTHVAYTSSDAIRILGGEISIVNNFIAYSGAAHGEAFYIQSGTVGDFSFNVFYSSASNGIHWSNEGGRTPQTYIRSYNNTFVNCGWRDTLDKTGASVYIAKGASGNSYNNLIINCKNGVLLAGGNDAADTANVRVDYSYYFGNEQRMVEAFYPTHSTLKYECCSNDIAGSVNENDPVFLGYDVSTTKEEELDYTQLDFRLNQKSPALNGAKNNFSPLIKSIKINGITFTNPKPKDHFGALSWY